MSAIGRALMALGCAVLAHSAPALAEKSDLALRVKATYLYKIAPFVEWRALPEGAPEQAFDICVVGRDPFGSILDEAVDGQQVAGAPVRVRRLPVVNESAGGCRIMYLAGSRAQTVDDALAITRGLPVLTVTDESRDSRREGVVHFVEVQGKIKFRIDNVLAEENHLVIAAQLLNLAVSVRASGPDRQRAQ